ncbi:MAG: hypothetical protein IKU30_08705 [Clostridia bacterium]|nr:hypothetical protein [Clostridia bacterium]
MPCEICGEYFDPDEIYYADKWRICLGCKDEIEKKYREWTQEIEAAFSGTFDKIEQAVIGELQMDGVID